MPFGLDLKSVIVGALFIMFVWPFIQQLIGSLGSKSAPAKKTA